MEWENQEEFNNINNQSMFIPSVNQSIQKSIKLNTILSKIVLLKWYNVNEGTESLTEIKCPVNSCINDNPFMRYFHPNLTIATKLDDFNIDCHFHK